MLVKLDHIGIVSPTLDEARNILEGKMGLILDEDRAPLPDGSYFAPEGTHNYFIQVGEGETQIEILIPTKPDSGTWKFLQRNGPGLHHLGYGCDDVSAEARKMREKGLRQIDLGDPDPDRLTAAFFHPKTTNGILTELVPVRHRH
jgi:methylmalonyl-CoA/ethylmalonyl-CoA epimerase